MPSPPEVHDEGKRWSKVGTCFDAAGNRKNSKRQGALFTVWKLEQRIVAHGGRVNVNLKETAIASAVATLDLVGPLAGKWVEIVNEDPGPSRWQHAGMMFDGGNLLIHGGKDGNGSLRNETWRYNFESRVWEPINRWAGGCEAPFMCGHAMTAVANGELLVIGQSARAKLPKRSRGQDKQQQRLHVFGLSLAHEDRRWRQWESPTAPPCRRDFSLAAVEEQPFKVILAGGYSSGVAFADVWSFDVRSSSWTEIRWDGLCRPPGQLSVWGTAGTPIGNDLSTGLSFRTMAQQSARLLAFATDSRNSTAVVVVSECGDAWFATARQPPPAVEVPMIPTTAPMTGTIDELF